MPLQISHPCPTMGGSAATRPSSGPSCIADTNVENPLFLSRDSALFSSCFSGSRLFVSRKYWSRRRRSALLYSTIFFLRSISKDAEACKRCAKKKRCLHSTRDNQNRFGEQNSREYVTCVFRVAPAEERSHGHSLPQSLTVSIREVPSTAVVRLPKFLAKVLLAKVPMGGLAIALNSAHAY